MFMCCSAAADNNSHGCFRGISNCSVLCNITATQLSSKPCIANNTSAYKTGMLMQVLNMSGNAAVFQGSSIPAALNKLKQLKRLDMSACGLTGPLPGALASLQNLELLDLSMNAGERCWAAR